MQFASPSEARSERQWSAPQAKAFADDVMAQARRDIAQAVRDAVRRDRLLPEDLAKRCGTSREAVVSLMAGATPSSLELALRMAGALGIDVTVQVTISK
jgi:ribosome-binding protein aMBF1 (putative translation factor)